MRILLLSMLALLPQVGHAQAGDRIRVGEDRLLSDPGSRFPLAEPHLTRNPDDSGHLLSVAIEVGGGCASFVSFDGGVRWTGHRFPIRGCVDPWVAILADSGSVFTALSDGELLVHRSSDGGRSWGSSLSLGRGHDHPTMVVDDVRDAVWLLSGRARGRDDGPTRWSVFVGRSEDGGRSFPYTRHLTPFDLVFEPHNGAVLSGGALLVPFSDHHAVDGRDVTNRSWMVRSGDGGETFSAPSLVAEGCFGPGGWPSLAVAPPASQWADRLFFVCVDRGFGGVLVRRSADAGRSWAGPVRADRDIVEPHVAVPSVAVDDRGVVAVTWQDRGDDPERRCQRLYVSASLDGGESFLPPRPVSSAPSCPEADVANRGAAGRWPYGGDYSGLVALGDGRFRAVWADARDGVYRLRTAEFVVTF